jgi:hypothetical protein
VHQISSGNSKVLFYTVLIITYFLISNSTFGQKIGFGPKLGANMSFFRGDFPLSGMRLPKFGYTFGGYMSVKGKKKKVWQFEMDILYTRRGHNANFLNINKDPIPEIKDELSYTIGYIEIPNTDDGKHNESLIFYTNHKFNLNVKLNIKKEEIQSLSTTDNPWGVVGNQTNDDIEDSFGGSPNYRIEDWN